MQTTARCSACGGENNVTIYQSINVRENPELKEKVRDGSLFVWSCPRCGQLNLALYQTLYHDPDERLMVWLLPEGSISDVERQAVEKHMAAIAAQMCSDGGGLDGYVLRQVSDAGSLIEKVSIHEAGLDDVVMEMCKYITKLELAGKEKDKERAAAIVAAPMKFYRIEGPDNDITFSYPLDGQMHGAQVGFNVYEDCRGIVQRNPSVRPEPGFVKVDADWLSGKIR
ncbi:MAG: CpXC domain-containing protein [Candidatus Cryptobacteroides sp.]